MTTAITQNGISLKTIHQDGELREAKLVSSTRRVEIEYFPHTGNWSIFLTKISIDYEGMHQETPLRTYTKMTQSDALNYFDKKQCELGFFTS